MEEELVVVLGQDHTAARQRMSPVRLIREIWRNHLWRGHLGGLAPVDHGNVGAGPLPVLGSTLQP